MELSGTTLQFRELVSYALSASYEINIPSVHKSIIEDCIGGASLHKEDLGVLYKFCKSISPTNVLEVGLATGSSAVCQLLSSCAAIRKYVVMDPFQTKAFEGKGISKLLQFSMPENGVEFYEEYSYAVLPQLLSKNYSFDYAFIDSSHKFDETLIEFFYIDKMLKIGGVIVMDDRPWPMVAGVIDFITENYAHFEVDISHPRLAFLRKIGTDRRKWYDFKRFDIPRNEFFEERIKKYQREQGSGFAL